MPLDVDRVSLTMELGGADPRRPGSALTDAELRERLRPVVVDILNTELERLRRQQG
jgi:hypothetical protein